MLFRAYLISYMLAEFSFRIGFRQEDGLHDGQLLLGESLTLSVWTRPWKRLRLRMGSLQNCVHLRHRVVESLAKEQRTGHRRRHVI